MKRFTKMLALGMAAALAFGMTVSAAESKDTFDTPQDIVNAVIENAPVQDADGNEVDVKVEAVGIPEVIPEELYGAGFGKTYDEAVDKALTSEPVGAAVDKVFEQMFPGVKPENQKVNHDIVDIEVDGEIPAGGLYVPVLPYADGCGYVVAHWNGTAWEVLQLKVEGDFVYALFPQGFSPVYLSILSVTSDEKPADPTPTPKPDESNNDNSGEPVSPKTGETLPVAGILAVVCLAGVAVCAKKASYNR